MIHLDKLTDKWQRNSKIYTHAFKAGKIMGYDYTWFLCKKHTKFLLRMRESEDKKKEIKKIVSFMESFTNVLTPYINEPIYSNLVPLKEIEAERPTIWIYWNDDSYMPQMVSKIIDQIRKNSNGCNVVVITENTVSNYIHFDDIIWRKYKEGKISLTHFTDLLRVSLLYKYGGVYMDSTLWLIRPLPEFVTSSDFYTYHSNIVDETNISYARWSSFFLACHKGNLMMKAALDVFVEYWHRYDYLVDYVLIDYVFNLIYNQISSVRNMIDAVPVNNTDIWQLQPKISNIYTKKDFDDLLNDKNRFLYKLSYKGSVKVPLRYGNGNITLKGWLCGEK